MKVQVLNNDGTLVWEFDAQERAGSNGIWWEEEKNHRLMAGIVGALFQAYSHADTRPPGWIWPSNPSQEDENGSKLGFLAIANIIAREGIPGAQPVQDNLKKMYHHK